MGYPGDGRPPEYGEWPEGASGPYGGADPYRPGGSAMPAGHDPQRGYPPVNEPPRPAPGGSGSPYGPHYGDGPGYGSGQQQPYPPPPGPQGPYGAPQPPYGGPAYGAQPGYGAPGDWQQPPMGGPGGGPGGPGGPGYPGYGGPPPQGPGGNGGGNNKMLLIIGGIVGAVVLLGGGGTALVFALNSGGDPDPKPTHTQAAPGQTTEPSSPSPSPVGPTSTPSSHWRKLASRATDPQPLTMREVFGRASLHAHGHSYRLVERRQTSSCGSAVTGEPLRSALDAGDCTQLLRATYLRDDGKVMGTVGIGNLDDSSDVRHAFSVAAGGGKYVTPLRGSGATARLGRGAALGVRQVKGHYLVLSWVQYADGHRPSSSGRRQLSAFHKDVVTAALARPLAYRMLTGRPAK